MVGLDKVRMRAGHLGSRRSGQGTSEGRTLGSGRAGQGTSGGWTVRQS